jgi:hypothetical protein
VGGRLDRACDVTEGVTIALITAIASVLVAVVGTIGGLMLTRLRAIEAQVANDHRKPDGTPLNLRDDLDTKHDENKGISRRIYELLVTVQRDVAWLMRQQAETDDRLDGLEDTINPRETPRAQPHPPHTRRSQSAVPHDDTEPVDSQP